MPLIIIPKPPRRDWFFFFVGMGVGIVISATIYYFAIGPRPPTAVEAAPAQR